MIDKKSLSERDICTKFITPAIKKAGWNTQTQLLEEVSFTDGKIYVRGKMTARGARKRADYILYYKPNIPIAIVEAKDNKHSVRAGMQQALDYAKILDIPFVFSSNGDGFLFHDSLDQPLSNYTEKNRVNAILANPPFGGIVANNNENNFPQNFRTKESADLFLILMIHLLKQDGRAGIVLPDGSLTGDGVKQRVRQKLLEDCNLHTIIRLPNSVFQPYATVATNLLFFTKGESTKEIWYYEHRLPETQKAYSKTRPIQVKEFEPIKKWWNDRKESDISWKVGIDEIKKRNYDLDIKNPTKQKEDIIHSSTELMQMLETSFSTSSDLLNKLKEAVK